MIVVVGKSLHSPDYYDYNYNISYYFINDKNVDGVIVSSGTISKYASKEQLEEFIHRFNIPVVSMSLPIGMSCCIDNKQGFKSALQHLIAVHNKRQIAFITGPDDHLEAIERFNVYKDTLAQNNISFNQDLIIKGDFTIDSATSSVSSFLRKNIQFDAIVSSNDEMAFGAIKVLKENNIRVPEDIPIIGFDNVSASMLLRLTTVNQPIYDLGYNSLEMLVNAITKKEFESRVLGTKPIIRDSCGCKLDKIIDQKASSPNSIKFESFVEDFVNSEADEISAVFDLETFKRFLNIFLDSLANSKTKVALLNSFDEIVCKLSEDNCFILFNIISRLRKAVLFLDIKQKVVENYFFDLTTILIEQLNRKSATRKRRVLDSENNLRRILIRMLTSMNDFSDQKKYLIEKFKEMGIESFYIYLYENNFSFNKPQRSNFIKPKNLKLILTSQDECNEWVSSDEMFSELLSTQFKTYILFPLFFQDEQLGLALYEFRNIVYDNSVFETLTVDLSCAIKISQLMSYRQKIENKLQNTLMELESYNQELNYLSTSDELTGLYNRRGFYNLAQKSVDLAQKSNNNGFLFFADMDGLKQINDTYGHEEGDNAILAMTGILKSAFRSNDIIARFGGDEFTILAITSYEFYEDLVYGKIRDLIDDYNNKSKKSYKLSISFGCASFRKDEENISVDLLISKADNLLYEEKRKKKILNTYPKIY